MIFLLQLTGYGLMALAIIHGIFPKVFEWKRELASLSLINQQLMTVHTFFVALIVFMMGLLCVSSAEMLLHSALGKRILLGLSIFWGVRLLAQLFWYSPQLWKGKRKETLIHILFIIIWSSVTTVFAIGATS